MRATENSAKGTSGQSFVKGQFEELGWGAVPNPEHDLGTDLLLMARDARRFDLGALVGAQVKNWALEFDAPNTHNGVEGWWFADSEAHFAYWLDHRIPHIVVFYDQSKKVSHWVHITRDATVSTGKQRKIFVPKAQTIDADHFDALVEVATSSPTGETWEGSAWRPGKDIPLESRLRYALLVPRLIAPHGNSSIEEMTPDQAIAMVTAVRLWEVYQRGEAKQPHLGIQASLDSEDQLWRLYGALLSWVEKGDMDPLRVALSDVPAHVRAAHTAALAAALYEEGDVREAIELVRSVLKSHDDYNPVDHAWLTLHLARNLVQVGQLAEARALALDVVPIGQIAYSDPTARFLTGIASDMVFSLSDWRAIDLAATIQARDTAASWWRSQSMTWGLAKHLETAFKSWTNDPAITFGGTDETWMRLRSTTLISGFAADTPNWGSEASLLAQHMLMLNEDSNQVSSALDLLRLAGANKELKLAVERILSSGPVGALERVVDELDLDAATRSSLHSDLELLGLAAPIVAVEVADRTVAWLLAELDEPETRARALGLRFIYAEQLFKTLARLYMACSEETQAAVRCYVVELPVIEDQLLAHHLASLVGNIRDEDWTDEQIDLLGARAEGDNFELKDALESLIAKRDLDYRLGLPSRISEGDVQALTSWGDVRDLPMDAAAGMIVASAAAVRSELDAARKGMYAFGGPSPLRRLVLLNVWHPGSADWAPCVEALADERSNPNDLLPGLQLMVVHAGHVPDGVREDLRLPLQRLSLATPSTDDFRSSFTRAADARGAATDLLAALFPAEISEDRLLRLLGGTPDQVATGIRIVASREDAAGLPLLAALAASEETEIRSAAAAALGAWVSKGIGGDAAQDLLRRLLDEPGVRLATHVTRAIARQPRSDAAEVVLGFLELHPSATVRIHVRTIRRNWADSGST